MKGVHHPDQDFKATVADLHRMNLKSGAADMGGKLLLGESVAFSFGFQFNKKVKRRRYNTG